MYFFKYMLLFGLLDTTIIHSLVEQVLWESLNRCLLRCLITCDYTLSCVLSLCVLHTHQIPPPGLINQAILPHITFQRATDAAERHAYMLAYRGREQWSHLDSHEQGLSVGLQQT